MLLNYANHIKNILKNQDKKCSDEYINELEKISNSLVAATNISKIYSGIIAPTTRHYYASLIYTSLINRSIGLGIILPYNSLGNIDAEYVDHGTAAVITRSIFEIRLCFHYLCIDECKDEEFDCRINLFNLHDCCSRIKIIDSGCRGFLDDAEIIKEKIMKNSFFSQFPQKKQSELLKSKTHFLYSLVEVAKNAGIDEEMFKIVYPLLSMYVHCLPFSFYRNGESNRGTGVYNKVDEKYLIMHMKFSCKLLDDSTKEYVAMWNPYTDLVLETKKAK